MLSFLRTHWRWLLPVLALVLLTGAQAANYAAAWLTRRHLRTAQAQASAQHAQRLVVTTARYTGYRLDSVKRATEAQQLLREIHLSQKRDAKIDSQRPARVALPAWGELPRE